MTGAVSVRIAIVISMLAVVFEPAFPAAAEQPLAVAAASSMSEAMTDMATAFETETGTAVKLSVAASSQVARQMINGAPVGVLVVAHPVWMEQVVASGRILARSVRTVAMNRLVLIAHEDRRISEPVSLDAIFEDVESAKLRVAVADMDHVPAGIYAAEALAAAGWLERLDRRLVRLPNVRAVLAFTDRGETPFGIVYASDVRIARHSRIVTMFEPESHAPIRYLAGAAEGSSNGAAFLDFMVSAAGRNILTAAGFLTPDTAEASDG